MFVLSAVAVFAAVAFMLMAVQRSQSTWTRGASVTAAVIAFAAASSGLIAFIVRLRRTMISRQQTAMLHPVVVLRHWTQSVPGERRYDLLLSNPAFATELMRLNT